MRGTGFDARPMKFPKEYLRVLQDLAGYATERPETNSTPLFLSVRDLLSFAALVGVQEGKKRPISAEQAQSIPDKRRFYDHGETVELYYAIALADASDGEILKPGNEDSIIEIVEEYVSGGLAVIDGWLRKRITDEDPLEAIVAGLRESGRLTVVKDDSSIPKTMF